MDRIHYSLCKKFPFEIHKIQYNCKREKVIDLIDNKHIHILPRVIGFSEKKKPSKVFQGFELTLLQWHMSIVISIDVFLCQ